MTKLLKIERTINIYDKKEELPKAEIDINNISIETLKDIVIPTIDDPLLYNGYKLNEEQLSLINTYLKEKVPVDLKKNEYYLVCGGIYDWK